MVLTIESLECKKTRKFKTGLVILVSSKPGFFCFLDWKVVVVVSIKKL